MRRTATRDSILQLSPSWTANILHGTIMRSSTAIIKRATLSRMHLQFACPGRSRSYIILSLLFVDLKLSTAINCTANKHYKPSVSYFSEYFVIFKKIKNITALKLFQTLFLVLYDFYFVFRQFYFTLC